VALAQRFVYVIAFKEDRFVMVRHRLRKWEMPGGRVEAVETDEEAAVREFLEETGMGLDPVDSIDVEGGKVFVGVAGRKVLPHLAMEIVEVREFSELPKDLSFPEVEYRDMLARAKSIMETFKRRKNIVAPASPQAKPDVPE
jgi:8-oxo-dGTP diphosphatase